VNKPMFGSVLTPETIKAMESLSSWPPFKDYYLAGGTAVALQLGHRISHDLDFFTAKEFSHQTLAQSLRKIGPFVVDYTDANTLVGRLNNVKTGFFHYLYPLLKSTLSFQGVAIASLEDLACSKVDAISSRGNKRDFADLYFIMKALRIELKDVLALFEKKYGREQFNLMHIQKSLVFFEDADQDPDLRMLVEFSWEDCQRFFVRQTKEFTAE